MSLHLLVVPRPAITVHAHPTVDGDQSHYIFDHLVHYCSLSERMPPITVRVDASRVVAIRGRIFLAVAERLARDRVLVAVDGTSDSEAVKALAARDDVDAFDVKAQLRKEAVESEPEGPHVVYFERPLTGDEKRVFEKLVSDHFARGGVVPVVMHDDAGPSAEFRAPTPVADHRWARGLLSAQIEFSTNVVRIVSYLGARFRFGGDKT